MATNALKVTSLEPKYGHNRITNARFIQGGYFVVEKFSDLSSEDLGLTPSPGVYTDEGTIVVGSLCYCQQEHTRYICTAVDTENNTSTWEVDNQGGGLSGGNVETEETEPHTENLVFNLLTDGTWAVSGKKDEADSTGCKTQDIYTNVVIPSAYNGIKVTRIADHAFDSCSKLETVVIPDSITFIQEKAFHKCSSLKYVEIPDSVIDIGSDGGAVFEGCSNLKWVAIPTSVKTIALYTFNGCEKATIYYAGAEIPKGWQVSGSYSWNTLARPVVKEYYVEVIKSRQTIISNGLTYTTSKGLIVKIGVVSGSHEIIGTEPSIDTTLVIPGTYKGKPINSIAEGAFENCSSIKRVIIGKGVLSISSYAFRNCTNLKQVEFSDSILWLKSSAFANCSSLENVYIPDTVNKIDVSAFFGVAGPLLCAVSEKPTLWNRDWYDPDTTKVQWGYPLTLEEKLKRIDDILYFIADKAWGVGDIEKAGLSFLYPH